MIQVRFDLVMRESDCNEDRTSFVHVEMSEVPLPGELVNLRGNPCRVIERSWSIVEGVPGVFAHVRVVSAVDHATLLREYAREKKAGGA